MTQHPWNKITSSWGCVQALTITLTIILLLPVPGGALEPGIDLLRALNFHTNISEYDGVSKTQGDSTHTIAYHLENRARKIFLPSTPFRRVADLLRNTPEFTFTAILKQELRNTGTIVAFSGDYWSSSYLEFQSSGRHDEVRIYFTYKTSDGAEFQRTETFPYKLADDTWHKIAISISGTEIQLIIDCHPLYKRVTNFIPDRNFSASNMKLFVGQRNLNNHSFFKGDLQEVHLIPGPYGYLSQCEEVDSQCPSCGQFLQLQNSIVELRQSLLQLTQRLVAAENRVSYIEECDCKKSCDLNGTIKNDGEIWDMGCIQCKCDHGTVTCGPRPCEPIKCKHPVVKDGECCPSCLKNCFINKKDYEHGEKPILGCRNCSCNDGTMQCDMVHCPKLACSADQQVSIPDDCCKFCPGEDYCSKGHACHTNATCLNLNTKYTCTCRSGFQGDGFHCTDTLHRRKVKRHRTHSRRKKKNNDVLEEDIDECAQQGGLNGNHCHLNTKCKNTFGSYVCECLPGYRRLDKFNCIEIDECATGQHSCHENSDCINTQGSYHCRCREGYAGDGYDCKPTCNQVCLNGGDCISPGVCKCRRGYVGNSCEKDLDECSTGQHRCRDTSVCVNMPGWYYCKCKPGYETIGDDCVDIDECYHKTHSCHHTAKCVNTKGHFECRCPKDNGECKLSCMFEDMEIDDGALVSPHNQPCKLCTCSKGVISCMEQPCNCSTWRSGNSRDLCCPQCDPKESCQHQELNHVTFRSGEKWIYQCQTCECLYGEFDCWKLECPPLICDNPLPLSPGDCCPRCPNDYCHYDNITAIGKSCSYDKHIFPSGQTFKYPSRDCVTCTCKDGKITCRYDVTCIDDDIPEAEEFTANASIKINNINNKSSKTKTSKTLLLSSPSSGTDSAAASEDAAPVVAAIVNPAIPPLSLSASSSSASSALSQLSAPQPQSSSATSVSSLSSIPASSSSLLLLSSSSATLPSPSSSLLSSATAAVSSSASASTSATAATTSSTSGASPGARAGGASSLFSPSLPSGATGTSSGGGTAATATLSTKAAGKNVPIAKDSNKRRSTKSTKNIDGNKYNTILSISSATTNTIPTPISTSSPSANAATVAASSSSSSSSLSSASPSSSLSVSASSSSSSPSTSKSKKQKMSDTPAPSTVPIYQSQSLLSSSSLSATTNKRYIGN